MDAPTGSLYPGDSSWAARDLFSLLTPAPLHLLNAKNLKTLQKVPDEQGKLNFDLLNCQKKQCSRWDGQRFIFTSCTLHISASNTHYKTLKKPGKYCQKRCVRFVFTFYICPPYILTARRQKKADKYCKTRCVIYHFHFLHLPPLHTPC